MNDESGYDEVNQQILSGSKKIPCFDDVNREFKIINFGWPYEKYLRSIQNNCILFSNFSIRSIRKKLKKIRNNRKDNETKKALHSKKLKPIDYADELKRWSVSIKKIFPICFCGEKSAVSHHILFRCHYPALSLNQNNGIALCHEHHKEIHKLNPWRHSI